MGGGTEIDVLAGVELVSVLRAELCSDHPPPGKYGCDEQRDFDKCWADFMKAGDFCKRTCGRCQGENSSRGIDSVLNTHR